MPIWKRYRGKRVQHGSPDYKKATWVAEGMCAGVRYLEALPDSKTREDAVKGEDRIRARIRAGEYDFHKDKTSFRDYVEKIYIPRARTDNASFGLNKKYQIPVLLKFFGDLRLKNITRLLCENLRSFLQEQRVTCQRCEKFKESCYLCSGEKPRYKAPCWKCKKRIETHAEHKKTCRPAPLSSSTVNRHLTTLSDILTDAVIDKKIRENPMRFVKLLPEPKPRARTLSPAEKDRLFAAFADKEHSSVNKRLWALVLIACTTTWREGRIMNLKKEDLDFETGMVWVGKSKQDEAKYAPVSRVTWSVLENLSDAVESGHLFRNSVTGEPLKCFPYDSWRALLDRAGIDDLKFHDLRHQAATDLYNLGTKLFGIQNALGHKRITTTQRYVTVTDETLREDLENLGETYESFLM